MNVFFSIVREVNKMPSDQENSLIINLEENLAQTRPTGAAINNNSIETMTGYELKANLSASYIAANLEWTSTSANVVKTFVTFNSALAARFARTLVLDKQKETI